MRYVLDAGVAVLRSRAALRLRSFLAGDPQYSLESCSDGADDLTGGGCVD
jgi:hypothetical protein